MSSGLPPSVSANRADSEIKMKLAGWALGPRMLGQTVLSGKEGGGALVHQATISSAAPLAPIRLAAIGHQSLPDSGRRSKDRGSKQEGLCFNQNHI